MSSDNEKTMTALDYIQKQEALEMEARESLPGKFETCTFSLGYIRQPVYACQTCSPNSTAGLCYSCSMACHAEHDLIELFAKRHFRCDCGLSDKFSHPCALTFPAKALSTHNPENRYNHNFLGRYCRCDQAYDPEKEEGVMFQCVACEDWFHDRCVGQTPESIEAFDSYVCRHCTKRYPFLIQGEDNVGLGLSKEGDPIHHWVLSKQKIPKEMTLKDTAGVTNQEDDTVILGKRKAEEPLSCLPTKKLKENGCKRIDSTSLPQHDHIELFLQDAWRQDLCRCEKCLEAYKAKGIEFLLEEETTFEPEEDQDASKSLLDIGMEQLQRMDRVKALESLMAYQHLAQDLKTYLSSFKDSGKTVTKEDVEAFFAVKIHKRTLCPTNLFLGKET
ncbi:putative zinc finger in N-recognin-domain-containing protein [Sporodiniella umbellata]|nr:putative zinc finger in N-recognin-domain-containing protein [Sporodiniella umbellata]